jgi:hypothetical protein
MSDKSVAELLDIYMEQEKMTRMEGRKGVENLCKIARALGYKDPMYWGQLTSTAAIGDLIMMLEDNSGMIEAMLEWIGSRDFKEFREPLEDLIKAEDAAVDHYEDGVCPDCGEEINPASTRGDECDNCGHVFNWGEVDDDAHYQPTNADFRCTGA